jgi:hypothetical protein
MLRAQNRSAAPNEAGAGPALHGAVPLLAHGEGVESARKAQHRHTLNGTLRSFEPLPASGSAKVVPDDINE